MPRSLPLPGLRPHHRFRHSRQPAMRTISMAPADRHGSEVMAGVAVAVFVVVHYFLGGPPSVDFTSGVTAETGANVNVVMQEDPKNTVSTHPDWVSYFIQDPTTKQWEHTTTFKVPAGSVVNMTILGYDGCTPVRNPVFGKVTGTIGGVEYVNGKPISQLDSWAAC